MNEVERINGELERTGLGAALLIGMPNQPVLDVPVGQGRTGMIVMPGLNALAAVEEAGIRTDRLAALSVLLVDFALKLEPLVWNTWRTLSPRSGIRPPRGLTKMLGEFLSEDSPSVDQKVERELKMLQRLIAAIITAVGGVGKQFAKKHLARFSPSEISALVRMERGSVLLSHEVKCWRKYFELAETLTEDAMETELRKAVADYAESLIKGLNR